MPKPGEVPLSSGLVQESVSVGTVPGFEVWKQAWLAGQKASEMKNLLQQGTAPLTAMAILGTHNLLPQVNC